MSFHKFLQTLKPEDANRGILLAPTGPYKEVIQAIADQTGLTPWWTAHSDLGVDLDPYSAVEFLKKVKVSGRQIYFLIPRNFKTFHKNSHTFKEYKLLMSNFSEHVSSTTFVFGFEKNFPLDYKRRLTAQDEKKKLTTQEVKKDYEDRIVRIFLTKFKKWLESMGSEVPSYKLKTDFQTSLYPVIYHQVLSKLTAHKVARKMHSEAMPTGPVRLLDLGGGTGLVTLQLMKDDHRRGVEIFDSSEAMLDMAVGSGVSIDKVHLSKVTHLVRRSGYLVESNSIDGITCSNVLYLLSELTVRRFFKEAHRVLKSGGRLSISSMLKTSAGVHQLFLESVFKEAEVLEREGKLPLSSKNILKSSNNQLLRQNPTFFNFEEISQMAKSFGFKPVGEPQFVYGKAGFFIVLEKN